MKKGFKNGRKTAETVSSIWAQFGDKKTLSVQAYILIAIVAKWLAQFQGEIFPMPSKLDR